MNLPGCVRIFSMILIILGVQLFSLRHFHRTDFSKEQLHSVSPSSIPVLQSIQKKIEIYIYFSESHTLTSTLKHLMDNIQFYCPKLQIKWIDPYKDQDILASLGKLAENFALNSMLLKFDDRHRFLTLNDIGLFDRQYESLGLPPQLIGFNGEKAILSALQDMSSDAKPLVGLIMNHGERDPNALDNDGVSSLIEILKWKGFHFTLLPLNQLKTLPDTLKILISIQPKIDFSETELLVLDEWLEKGGKLLLAIDPLISSENKGMMDFNLNTLLKKRGIEIQNSIVVDPVKQIPYSRADHLYIDQYGDNQITAQLKKLPSLFFQCRSIRVFQTDTHHIFPLLGTSGSGWGETLFLDSNYVFDPATDFKGPVMVGAASFNPDTKERVIVFGDSDFLSNFQLKQGANAVLAESCFEWLSQNDYFEDLKPKLLPDLKTNLNRDQLKKIFVILLAIPLGWLAICALILKARRRRKFTAHG